ncbi:MAG: TRAP transporter fused permease subunit [Alphaproteobacteria bacterium]|nr:TRAP transporter fused permease subunit [Alphaproteobacteria bacterium]
MSTYHLVNSYYFMVGSIEHKMIHLSFAIALVFLAAAMDDTRRSWLYVAAIVVGLLSILYLKINLERLFENIGFPEFPDLIAAALILGVVLWACVVAFGWILPLVAASLFVYGLTAHYMGGPILSLKEIISTVALTFGSYDMWGKILDISANTIFLFVLYGGMYQGVRATKFFDNLSGLFSRYARSGPAMSAVISSALMGTTTGQTSPNVAITGAFTIPMMKRIGYKPHIAAAIEAAASAGGQIMPPIMGAGAFVMADILGISYFEVIKMALVPAVLYFGSVAIYVHLHALKTGVSAGDMPFSREELWQYFPVFAVPLATILIVLGFGYPPMVAAFWAIALLLIISTLRKITRPTMTMVLDGCVKGATIGAKVAIACATLGPLIALVTKTGLALKIGASVELWSQGNLFLGLLILMAVVIVLGLEVPTVAAYLIAAIVAIPVLVRLGLNTNQAHMFAFYFGGFSALTPPVGMAAIVAAKIANASYLKTALQSVIAAMAAFLIPFVFVYEGSLLLLPGSTVWSVMTAATLTLLGVGLLQAGAIGYLFHAQNWIERVMYFGAGGGLLFGVASKSTPLILAALSLMAVAIFVNSLKARRAVEKDGTAT